jgi:hypothetical protein
MNNVYPQNMANRDNVVLATDNYELIKQHRDFTIVGEKRGKHHLEN